MASTEFVSTALNATLFPADPTLPPGFIQIPWWRKGDEGSPPDILLRIWSDPIVQVSQVCYASEGLVDGEGHGQIPETQGGLTRVTFVMMTNGKPILTGEPLGSLLARIAAEQQRLRKSQE